jgi:tetratricopeptide (TPR) repeat protein
VTDATPQDTVEATPDVTDPVALVRTRWKGLWQIPGFVLASGVLVAGLAYALATRPDPDFRPTLRAAAALIEREQYREAIELLNAEILPYVGRPELPARDTGEFHRLIGHAVYSGQKAIGFEHERNFRSALQSLREAETVGVSLCDREQFIVADCYLQLGEPEPALARVELIKEEESLRRRVLKDVIARALRAKPPRLSDAEVLLSRMAADPLLPLDEQAWVTDQQAEVELSMGLAEAAITRILRAMPRLTSAGEMARAGLHLTLARAYLDANATEEGWAQLSMAEPLIPSADALEARLRLLRARAHEQRGEYESARDVYLSVLAHFQPSGVRVRAEHGAAVMEASLGNHLNAQQLYASLVAQVQQAERDAIEARPDIVAGLLSIFRDQVVQQGVDSSFRYAELAGQMYPIEEAPDAVYEALGLAHRLMADRIAELAPKRDGPLGPELDPSTEREVQRHRIRSATFYRLHAMRFVVTDLKVYADSMWMAANLYDEAGDQGEAAETFRRFVEDLPTDARQPEARFRLAQARAARGMYTEAATLYRTIIDDRDRGSTQSSVGRYANQSHVPLAQVYLLDDDPENDDDAELLLERVISGELGGPDSTNYLPALVAMADLWQRRQEHARAIEGYEQVIERSAGEPLSPVMTFKLADSYRLNGRSIETLLGGSLTDGERRLLTETRVEHLRRAIDLYEQARTKLESVHIQKRTPIEQLALRNAYFYLGDCAFDLGETDAAVTYYNAARERFPSDPASLVALVQIVNAYVRDGNLTSARSANERARIFYESLPPDVWDDPNLPMSRRDWERWLASSSTLYADGK